MQGTHREESCHQKTKVSCTLELIVGLEPWSSTRGDFCPLKGHLTVSGDMFDCYNYWKGWGFIYYLMGKERPEIQLSILQCTGRRTPPMMTYLPNMLTVPKVGNTGLEGEDQKRGWNESGAD